MARAGRAGALAALAVPVALTHGWLADHALDAFPGTDPARRPPTRIEVAFVRVLEPAAPRPLALPPARRSAQRGALAPMPAASVPDALPGWVPDAVPALTARLDPIPAPLTRDEPAPPAVAAPALPADTTAAAAFEWPPSTRLSYRLTGHYRGPVEGQAQVQWLRSGERYQVHLDVEVGPSFAPLIARRMSSDGQLGPDGLRPRRYDEETRVALRSPRLSTVWFDETVVRLPAGTELPRPPGVQDSASQFVQMTWLFTLDPARLEPGRSVDIPLALPRRLETWTYDVIGRETVDTPAGPVAAVHVKPRRELGWRGDLTPQMWIAPSLQYLPVRILIHQDRETWVDLVLDRLPEQAAQGTTR